MEAYPANEDPTANWPPEYWNNLFRTMELGKGGEHMEDQLA